MKRVLIAGAGSYIGTAVEKWLIKTGEYEVEVVDLITTKPEDILFDDIDVVFDVAGIAHIKETEENAPLYYKVNRDLAIDVAKHAKQKGVKQFILLSSMSVYGINTGSINKETAINPKSHYAKAKYQADVEIEKMADDNFRVCILRPPMVYGKGCKGNYQLLRKVAMKSPIFPSLHNQRSMIYIDNLCSFVEVLIRHEKSGLFFPQNTEYVSTADMVRCIAKEHNHKILFIGLGNIIIKNMKINVFEKVFGSLIYECKEDRCGIAGSFAETIHKTEEE